MNTFLPTSVCIAEGQLDNPPNPAAQPNLPRDEAFSRIVHQHARLMYRVAHSLLRHPQDAEDAVQDALLKLYRGDAWRHMQDERAFLARTVWRTAFDRLQARLEPTDEAAELRLRDYRPTPEQAAADDDEQGLLHHLIDRLPPELRQPLLLSAIDELTSREIGLAMDLPEGTVRTRLMRARAELRRNFEALTTSRPGETAVAGR
jgi:RNA polymerase sigma-70 factor (ECF subfamily)